MIPGRSALMSQRSWAVSLTALLAGVVAGCGDGPSLARVSGVVTLNGKPYPNALVSFQPMASKESQNPGKGSVGQTDENGRFELVYEGRKKGAVVGKHTVRISTMPGKGAQEDPALADKSLGTPDGYVPPRGSGQLEFDPIPPEWNDRSSKTFNVTPSGTDKANFDVVTRRAR
jgi:hypothetical protein